MKIAWKIIALTLGVVLHSGQASGQVAYEGKVLVNDRVAARGLLLSGSDFSLTESRRTETGRSEVHDREIDIFYILAGSATFVTGGTMVGEEPSQGRGTTLGSGIEGGDTHQFTAGDVIVVPAGTPHWFKEVPEAIDYLVIKVIKL